MLSLHKSLQVDKSSLHERRLEQAIAAKKLNQENFNAIVEVFNRRSLPMEDFWNYVKGQKMKWSSSFEISDAIGQVLSLEEFNNLIDNDITWV